MKYYKITNKKEIHNGLQYHTGLNVDLVPFNPSGNCETGGIYFAREDIFVYLCYGYWIREVTLPKDAHIYKDPGKLEKWKANKVILGERRKIDSSVIKELVEQGANIHIQEDCILISAVEKGYLDIVKYLVKNGADIHAQNDLAMRVAASKGDINIIKYLIKQNVKLSEYAVQCAASRGRLRVVKYLVKQGYNITNEMVYWAARNGHLETVKYLIKHGGKLVGDANYWVKRHKRIERMRRLKGLKK